MSLGWKYDSSEELNRIEDKIDKLCTLIELASGLQIQEIEKAVIQESSFLWREKSRSREIAYIANEVLEFINEKAICVAYAGGDYLDDCPIQEPNCVQPSR